MFPTRRFWHDLFVRAGMVFEVAPGGNDHASLPKEVRAAITEDTRARLRAHQVDAILRMSPVLMFVNAVNAALIALVVTQNGGPARAAAIWAAGILLVAGLSFFKTWRKRHVKPPETTRRRTLFRVIRSAGLFGLIWTVPGLLWVPQLDGFALGFCMAVVTGMIAGSAYALYPIPMAALAFMAPATGGVVLGLSISHGWMATEAALVAAMFLTVFVAGTRRHAEVFVSEFILRLELERRSRLIDDLIEDKRLEDEARRRVTQVSGASPDAMEAAGQLAGSVAHYFNNLFATIRGNAELLEIEGEAEAAMLRPIVQATESGASRIENLLMITGKHPLTPEAVQVVDLLGDFEKSLVRAGVRGRPLRHGRDGTGPVVRADAAGLSNSLALLIADARASLHDGGTVTLALRSAGEALEIVVEAPGWHIGDDLMQRADTPIGAFGSRNTPRLLDFAYVRAFARRSGGQLTLEKGPQGELRAVLSLPVADVALSP